MPITLNPGEARELNVLLTAVIVNGQLYGYVTDAASGDPISGALIEMAGPQGYNGVSNALGYFEINDVLAGDYTVTVSATGYETVVI